MRAIISPIAFRHQRFRGPHARLHMRRLARLTYAFSKKRENFEAAVALHFAYYNFVKRYPKHNAPAVTATQFYGFEEVRPGYDPNYI